jgi:germination protein M
MTGAVIICILALAVGCSNPILAIRDWISGGEEIQEGPVFDNQLPDTDNTNGTIDARKRDTVLYYRDDKGYLVPVSVDIEWEEGIAKAALARLIADNKSSEIAQKAGLYSAIPEGTDILGLTIRDGLAKIDLSAEALNYNTAGEEELMIKSVVYTLTEFNTVDRVQFMFEGDTAESLQFGSNVGRPVFKENINAIDEGKGSKVTVFFYRVNEKGFKYFVPVTLSTGTAGTDMDAAVKCLLEGPPEGSDLLSDIPEGISINGMGVKNGIAYLNFEKGIFDYQGSDSMGENIVKSIALTLKEYPSVAGVIFLTDGETASLPSGMMLESVIDVPVFANEYN